MSKQKPVKLSNFAGLDNQNQLEQYVRTLDNDVSRIVEYLKTFPQQIEQDSEPTISNGDIAFWRNTSDNKFYLIWTKNSTQRKVELT